MKTLGMRKHRISGISPKSPKLRLKLRMEAEKNIIINKHKFEMVSDIKKLFI